MKFAMKFGFKKPSAAVMTKLQKVEKKKTKESIRQWVATVISGKIFNF